MDQEEEIEDLPFSTCLRPSLFIKSPFPLTISVHINEYEVIARSYKGLRPSDLIIIPTV